MLATLVSEGYSVVEAKCSDDALLKLRHSRPDLILLDVNMSGTKGLHACREIRSGSDVPIIMLTVRSIERNKVMALDAGADDYVVKPFGGQEPLARIPAALRRATSMGNLQSFESNRLKIDFERRTVFVRAGHESRENHSGTASSSKPFGDRIMATKLNTYESSSVSSERKLS